MLHWWFSLSLGWFLVVVGYDSVAPEVNAFIPPPVEGVSTTSVVSYRPEPSVIWDRD